MSLERVRYFGENVAKVSYSFSGPFFILAGDEFEIIGSREGVNASAQPSREQSDMIHTIRRLKDGAVKEVKMGDLVKKILKDHPVTLDQTPPRDDTKSNHRKQIKAEIFCS